MYIKIPFLVIVAFLFQLTFTTIFAINAYPFPIKVTQTDGSQLTIKLHTDEVNHYQTSEDGYLLMKNSKCFITYAIINPADVEMESNYVVNDISKRTHAEQQFTIMLSKPEVFEAVQLTPIRYRMMSAQQTPKRVYPLYSKPKSLVIPTNFADNCFTTPIPNAAFTNSVDSAGYKSNGGTINITKTADSITFKLMGATPVISTANVLEPFTTMVGTTSGVQTVAVNVANLTGNIQIMLSGNSAFELKLSSESTWGKSLSITPVSGVVDTAINVCYNPSSVGSHSDQMVFSSPGAIGLSLDLVGTSTPYADPNTPKTFINKIENVLQFPATKVNSTKMKIINIKTTDLVSDLSVAVTGANADLFTISANKLVKSAANGTIGVNITINYKPITAGTHSATLTISGGGLNPDKVITLNGTGF